MTTTTPVDDTRLAVIRDTHASQQKLVDSLADDLDMSPWSAAGHSVCHEGRGYLLAAIAERDDLLGRFAVDAEAFRLGEEHERARVLAILDREKKKWQKQADAVAWKTTDDGSARSRLRMVVDLSDEIQNAGKATPLPPDALRARLAACEEALRTITQVTVSGTALATAYASGFMECQRIANEALKEG